MCSPVSEQKQRKTNKIDIIGKLIYNSHCKVAYNLRRTMHHFIGMKAIIVILAYFCIVTASNCPITSRLPTLNEYASRWSDRCGELPQKIAQY
ncbi:hypothetical protein Y032_0002g498 [Ancylostoma ceylanicum]|uniref:Uncharacterized protein n=1 Tax=Ancylostoma ceylanicum TaxID=53326 RepID=A0A016VZY0_9BILA|nr:hypothetical protein Y032_0002g498 [Ancylostoma ceylanicum]